MPMQWLDNRNLSPLLLTWLSNLYKAGRSIIRQMHMARKKGQAAMEYLMTYGWAILIVIIVVAALYAMGVFNVGSGTVKCSPCFKDFAFVDYAAGTLVLNNGPQEIYLLSVTGGSLPATTLYSAGKEIRITGISTTGNVDMSVKYNTTAGLNHTTNATIHN